MSISPRFLDELRSRLTLSDIIGRRVKVTRAGREFKACCPFHHEKTPSFTINDDKQFYHCFGCGAHGDVVGFVMRHDNLSFVDAVEMLCADAGLQMPKPDPQMVKKAKEAKSLYELMDQATKFFEAELGKHENATILNYLLERGLKPETLSNFRVGYAPDDGQVLRKYLIQQGFTDKDMIAAGITRASKKGTDPYAFFRGRIMFPVSDRRGRVVAFGGRILPDHMRPPERGDFTPPKYINTSDTTLFDKGRTLYGEALARQAAADGHSVIVTEGYMDVIAAHQAGFKGAVAPMGTALTEEQILSLWKMIPADEKLPVLCFDGDNAGRRAAARSCERLLPLLKPGQSARFAFMPDGEDPDTLIRAGGPQAFRRVLEGSLYLFDFLWASHTAGRKFDTPESRAGMVKALDQDVGKIADAEVQRHYRELARTKVSESFFSPRGSFSAQKRKGRKSSLKMRKPVFDPKAMHVRIFLAAILNHPHIFESFEEKLGEWEITDESLARLRQSILSILIEQPELEREGLFERLKNLGYEKEMGDILNESVYVHAAFAAPHSDSAQIEPKIYEWLSEIEHRDWREIKTGWKEAFLSSDKGEEEKLRQMIQARTSDAGS